MDFGALPPEINSARMYSGPRSGSMLVAADAWDRLADNLYDSAASCQSLLTSLTDDDWRGPASDSVTAAIAPYVRWLTATAAQAEQVARQARDAASAFDAAFGAVVPPAAIEANRAALASLIAGNIVSQDTPSITAVEAEYGEMWAQDADAMYRYAGASATAATLRPMAPPTPGGTAAGAADPAADVSDDTQDALAQAVYALPRALRALAQPSQSRSAALTALAKLTSVPSVGAFTSAISNLVLGQGARVGRLSVPRNWGDAAFGSLRSIA
ncbi:MAG: PPE family protein [Mycobacterium sp.]|uniref:PPE family protein n=1 Tax=Mycobacterium sp. TaxID=1785 RepID=UPI001EB16328|nr:PPE family protein [Mycobacterium sp.]MBW0019002.1 PPE family protein [Mycobacterium sp.]